MSDQYKSPLTARQRAAILRLYEQQRLPCAKTAKRLRLSVRLVVGFLRKRGVLRRQGPSIPRKLSLTARQKLEGEFATTLDVVLAKKYGLTKERIRQIRQEAGYPSSQVFRHALTVRAQAKHREEKQRVRELRLQQRRARRLLAVNRLSKRWKAGVPVAKLAQEFGYTLGYMSLRIHRLRKHFPGKLPFRNEIRSPRPPASAASLDGRKRGEREAGSG
ncbi:MAG: hypothetical protein ABSD58_11770 [Verrucomicrobiia bacterium]|jgi:hypothetical protein